MVDSVLSESNRDGRAAAPAGDRPAILEVKDIYKRFEIPLGIIQWAARKKPEVVTAVDYVSLEVKKGEILGIVGESGCGKTTLLRCIARLYEPESGEINFEGRNILEMSAGDMRTERRKIQMIFQDPYSSLNPRFRVGQMLKEVLAVHNICPAEKRDQRVVELLEMVGMHADVSTRFPSQFSGGQRQRIGIARALAMEPTLLLADEPVSALDVSVQAQVINLLMDLQRELSLTMVFVSHDLRVVRHVSDRVVVMYLGKVMEMGTSGRIFANPVHPYTRVLLAAAPQLDPNVRSDVAAIQGDPPSPIHIPPGCRFHPRCQSAIEKCRHEVPPLIEIEPGHMAACHLGAGPVN
jgi:oligopeptide/dipeptide ABC transporter ATP-binding protein